jgi:hypothetical protein
MKIKALVGTRLGYVYENPNELARWFEDNMAGAPVKLDRSIRCLLSQLFTNVSQVRGVDRILAEAGIPDNTI